MDEKLWKVGEAGTQPASGLLQLAGASQVLGLWRCSHSRFRSALWVEDALWSPVDSGQSQDQEGVSRLRFEP